MALQIQPTQPVFLQPTGPTDDPSAISATSIGGFITPPTAAETATGLSIANVWYPYGNMLRYGVTPNSAAAAGANALILQKLFNPLINGPTGLFYFPNTTGSDVYYFAPIYVQIRPGVHIDGCWNTVNFSGTYSSAFNSFPFWAIVQDASIRR